MEKKINAIIDELYPESSGFSTSKEKVERFLLRSAIRKCMNLLVDQYFPKWISVTEQMPEEGIEVLGRFPYGDESGNKVAMAIRYGDEIQSAAPTSTAYCFNPTHWMPMPTEII